MRAHTVFMHIFRIYAHLGASIQQFLMTGYPKMRIKNGWVEI